MSEQQEIKIHHNGVEITYNEGRNRFEFILRGRERHAESLAKAREFIDKPVIEKQEKDFKPIQCYVDSGRWNDNQFITCTATCIATSPSYCTELEFWTTRKGEDGKTIRAKEPQRGLYPVNPKNTELMTTIEGLRSRINALQKEIIEHKKKLKTISV